MGNRVAKAALDAVVGVVGAETGCPEIDDGRTLDREDGRDTQRHGESRDTQTVSNKAERETETERKSIGLKLHIYSDKA